MAEEEPTGTEEMPPEEEVTTGEAEENKSLQEAEVVNEVEVVNAAPEEPAAADISEVEPAPETQIEEAEENIEEKPPEEGITEEGGTEEPGEDGAETKEEEAAKLEEKAGEEDQPPHPTESPTKVMVFPPLLQPEFTVSDPIEFFGQDLPKDGKMDFNDEPQTQVQAAFVPGAFKTCHFSARPFNEKKIMQALTKVPPRHEYCGFIFSAQSQRPPTYYKNYFLPIDRQPLPKQHILLLGAEVPPDKILNTRNSPKNLVPLSAVKIRWRLEKHKTVYKLENIYAYLTRFGPIDGVYSLSVNSAMVIFSDLEAARSTVMCSSLGLPWDPIIATWAEPRMHNYGFFFKYASVEKPPLRMRL